jgi:hypothetical protein
MPQLDISTFSNQIFFVSVFFFFYFFVVSKNIVPVINGVSFVRK